MADLIAAERERLIALVEGINEDHKKVVDLVESNDEQCRKTVANAAVRVRVDRIFDRLEAKLEDPLHRSDDDKPPSKH